MRSPKNLFWATGGSVAINGALLALLVFTLPKAAAPLRDDTLWVSLETAPAATAGAPAMPPPSPPSASSPSASPPAASAPPAVTPPVPSVIETAERPPQTPPKTEAQTQIQTQAQRTPSSDSSPSPTSGPAAPSTSTRSTQSQTTQASAQAQQTPAQSQAIGGGSKHAASYAAKVRLHLERFKVYPPQAKRRHQTGVVGLSFTIDRQGRVLSAQVTKSSGVASLDQAALDMLAAAQPLPKPPADVAGERIGMTVPVEFGETD